MTSPLEKLEPLVGEWEFEATVDGRPTARGRTRFEWLYGTFMIQHADGTPVTGAPQEWFDNFPFPFTTIYALDDPSGSFSMLYADVRGVHRIYEMNVDGGTLEIWGRAGPEFFQRFSATLDGDTIAGRWERSNDGWDWETDFDISYARKEKS